MLYFKKELKRSQGVVNLGKFHKNGTTRKTPHDVARGNLAHNIPTGVRGSQWFGGWVGC